jgi:hypothetical protein
MAAVVEMQTAGGETIPAVYKGLTLHPAFPVPAMNELHVRYKTTAAIETELQITDLTGRVVLRVAKGKQQPGTHDAVVDISALPGGTYNYGVRFGKDILFSRFVKAD